MPTGTPTGTSTIKAPDSTKPEVTKEATNYTGLYIGIAIVIVFVIVVVLVRMMMRSKSARILEEEMIKKNVPLTLYETLAAYSGQTVSQVKKMTVEERDKMLYLYLDSVEKAPLKLDEKKRLSIETEGSK